MTEISFDDISNGDRVRVTLEFDVTSAATYAFFSAMGTEVYPEDIVKIERLSKPWSENDIVEILGDVYVRNDSGSWYSTTDSTVLLDSQVQSYVDVSNEWGGSSAEVIRQAKS